MHEIGVGIIQEEAIVRQAKGNMQVFRFWELA